MKFCIDRLLPKDPVERGILGIVCVPIVVLLTMGTAIVVEHHANLNYDLPGFMLIFIGLPACHYIGIFAVVGKHVPVWMRVVSGLLGVLPLALTCAIFWQLIRHGF